MDPISVAFLFQNDFQKTPLGPWQHGHESYGAYLIPALSTTDCMNHELPSTHGRQYCGKRRVRGLSTAFNSMERPNVISTLACLA